eukprot:CAMPEP_0172772110 /NCGR_PEP_ID=MMETSP1074-20121228/191779_1 /TAXON_ID=2916 /ORGANISM="Ceratium fusus, Strain PA161109" /LENGTH=53 /DNA_ID=CAMNT_0013608163 /DNA_START=259 /DNA_END=420 /DNA_ORIENTATION=+
MLAFLAEKAKPPAEVAHREAGADLDVQAVLRFPLVIRVEQSDRCSGGIVEAPT